MLTIGWAFAAGAMQRQAERLDVVANNLANAATGGYKAQVVGFDRLLAAALVPASAFDAPAAPPTVLAARTGTDFSPGPVTQTGRPLDAAIEGPGFFVVEGRRGPELTRNGAFTRDAQGRLVTLDGLPVLGADRRPVTLPAAGAARLTPDGTVVVNGAPVGRLLLVDVPTARLGRASGPRFVPTPDTPLVPAPVRLVPGALEGSNVNPILTLVELVDVLRTYEAAQRAVRQIDDTVGRAINDVGRLSGGTA
jgi:flagellar basal-body rod protein FlgG